MSVLEVQAFRDEVYARRRPRLPDGSIPTTTTVCRIAAWKAPLACPAASPSLGQEHFILVVNDEGKARPGHSGPWVMHPSASLVLARPLPDDSLVKAECQVGIVGQHILLEPLRVQALSPLYLQVPTDLSSAPDFPMVSITLRVQAVDSHPDACLLVCLPAGRFTQVFSLVPVTAGKAPLAFAAAITSLDQEYLTSVIEYETECSRHPFPLRPGPVDTYASSSAGCGTRLPM